MLIKIILKAKNQKYDKLLGELFLIYLKSILSIMVYINANLWYLQRIFFLLFNFVLIKY